MLQYTGPIIMFCAVSVYCFAQDEKLTEPAETLAQEQQHSFLPTQSHKPLILNLDESGNSQVRFILWNQFCVLGEKGDDGKLNVTPQIKRSRFLVYAQINDRFMALTHFGVNNLGSEGLHPTGQSDQVKVFLHDAWTEYKVWGDYLSLGAGLHYYNGLSRLSNAGTINFMTFDNYRQAWAQLGLSDQFGRHLGFFAKGRAGRLNYHLAINDAMENSLDVPGYTGSPGSIAYVGRKYFPEKASRVYQGYFDYQFLDKESNKLPYRTGSYLGQKKVFNIGVGFFSHPNGTVSIAADSAVFTHNVRHLAADVYYDAPLAHGGAISLYSAFFKFDYGPNYCRSGIYGTGNSSYSQLGYLLPPLHRSVAFMPYIAYSHRDYKEYRKNSNTLNLGLNFLLNSHNVKFTLEYSTTQDLYNELRPERREQMILQAMIFL